MDKIILTRIYDDGIQTLGVLISYKIRMFTLELAWKNNQKKISCIPKGTYKVIPRTSTKYGNHFHITNVQNRDAILFHAGNKHSDILGCILVGLGLKDINTDGLVDLTQSRNAMNLLLRNHPNGFDLEIV